MPALEVVPGKTLPQWPGPCPRPPSSPPWWDGWPWASGLTRSCWLGCTVCYWPRKGQSRQGKKKVVWPGDTLSPCLRSWWGGWRCWGARTGGSTWWWWGHSSSQSHPEQCRRWRMSLSPYHWHGGISLDSTIDLDFSFVWTLSIFEIK